jgi:outer membrane protein TolC
MRAMVEMAVAGVAVAQQGGKPDFTVGGMVDLKADPLMFRPTATVTLPVWREKIRANLAAASARSAAANARVSVEQLNMAAALAQMIYMIRDAESMLDYMDGTALPNLERSLASAEAGVQSGMGNPTMIAEVQLMALDMRHERLNALREHENAVIDLAAMTNEVLPTSTPLVTESGPHPTGSH